MPVEAVVVNGTIDSTVSQTTDFTSSGFGTPTAAIIIAGWPNATNNPQTDGGLSVGFWTSGVNIVQGTGSEDSQGSTDSARWLRGSSAVHLRVPNTDEFYGDVAAITDGIRFTSDFNEISGSADPYAVVVLIKGTTNAKALQYEPSSDPDTNTSVGFETDYMFVVTTGLHQTPNNASPNGNLSFGVVHKNSSDVISQDMMVWSCQDNVADGDGHTYSDNNWCAADNVTSLEKMQITAISSTGFTMAFNTSFATQVYHFLCLELDDADKAWVQTNNSRTATGDQVITGPGFTPSVVGVVSSGATANQTEAELGVMQIGVSDGTTTRSFDIRDEFGVATTDADSEADDSNILNLRANNGTDLAVASLKSLDSNGFTLNYTTAPGSAIKALMFAFGEGPGSIDTTKVSSGSTVAQPTVFSPTITPTLVSASASVNQPQNVFAPLIQASLVASSATVHAAVVQAQPASLHFAFYPTGQLTPAGFQIFERSVPNAVYESVVSPTDAVDDALSPVVSHSLSQVSVAMVWEEAGIFSVVAQADLGASPGIEVAGGKVASSASVATPTLSATANTISPAKVDNTSTVGLSRVFGETFLDMIKVPAGWVVHATAVHGFWAECPLESGNWTEVGLSTTTWTEIED